MSIRTEQVSALLQRIVGESLAQQVEFPEGVMVTLSRIDIPADLRHATLYVSAFPYDRSDEVMNILKRERSSIQKDVAKELAMKFTPKLHFQVEHQNEYADKLNRAIDDNLE